MPPVPPRMRWVPSWLRGPPAVTGVLSCAHQNPARSATRSGGVGPVRRSAIWFRSGPGRSTQWPGTPLSCGPTAVIPASSPASGRVTAVLAGAAPAETHQVLSGRSWAARSRAAGVSTQAQVAWLTDSSVRGPVIPRGRVWSQSISFGGQGVENLAQGGGVGRVGFEGVGASPGEALGGVDPHDASVGGVEGGGGQRAFAGDDEGAVGFGGGCRPAEADPGGLVQPVAFGPSGDGGPAREVEVAGGEGGRRKVPRRGGGGVAPVDGRPGQPRGGQFGGRERGALRRQGGTFT